jgi:hypothetical protein
VRDARPVAQIDSVTPDDARDRTASAAVRQDLPGLGGIGLDPSSVVADATDLLRPVIRRNP